MVPGGASPDDPALTDYWAERRRKHQPPLGEHTVRLLHRQQPRCLLCGDYILHADHEPTSPQEWGQWFHAVRKAITKQALEIAEPGRHGTPDRNRTRLLHRQTTPRSGNNPALLLTC
jgi:RNA-directed DNA polymerase